MASPQKAAMAIGKSSKARTIGPGMNRALWIAQILLAIFFFLAGYQHGLRPRDEAAVAAPWIATTPPSVVRFIAYAELAGAAGLVLPAVTGVAPVFVPLAAMGLAVIMALAVPFHVMRGESHIIGMHIVVGLLALFVAGGRLTPTSTKPRRRLDV